MTFRWFYIMNNQGLCYNFRTGEFCTLRLDCITDDQTYVDQYVARLEDMGHICMKIIAYADVHEIPRDIVRQK